jgi:hypothetical protein
MPRDQERINCPPGVWTELTNSDATAITFQVTSGAVKIRCTTGSAPSALTDAGFEYRADPEDSDKQGEVNMAIVDLSTAAGADRVFATPINGRRAKVVVSHA